MAKYNVYAVAYGVDPSINTVRPTVLNLKFKTWEECKPYVLGIREAKYKGFLTESEADAWLEKTITNLGESVPTSTLTSPVSNPHNTQNDVDYDKEFKTLCINLGVLPSDMILYLQKRFVEEQKFISRKALGLPWD